MLTVIGVQPATGVAVPVRGVVALLTDSPGAWVIVLLHTAEACCGVDPAEHRTAVTEVGGLDRGTSLGPAAELDVFATSVEVTDVPLTPVLIILCNHTYDVLILCTCTVHVIVYGIIPYHIRVNVSSTDP